MHPQAKVAITPGGRGDFIVKSDGHELWNKRAKDDEFPTVDAILQQLAGKS